MNDTALVTWRPAVADVQAVVPTRGGGAFSDRTTPTAAQVDLLVDQLVAEVVGEVGRFDAALVIDPDPSHPGGDVVTLGHLAHRAAVLGTALQVEDGWFPEQGGTERGERLHAQYLTALARLRSAIAELGEGGSGGAFTIHPAFTAPRPPDPWEPLT